MTRILVVDDNQKNLEAAKNQLTGCELTTCATFTEAKAAIINGNFHVVMTDVMMPGEKNGQGPQSAHYVGSLVPIGLVVALLALKQDVPHIYIVSDTNHHDHPVAWALDSIVGGKRIKAACGYACPKIDGAKNWAAVLSGASARIDGDI